MKTIHYYLSPKSPWTYLGHDRLLDLARRHEAVVLPKPMDLGSIFPVSGGLPLDKRPPQRQAYRITELKRWSEFLGMPLTIHPKFFPVDDVPAAKMVTAAIRAGDNDGALKLTGALLRAVWAEERNIADPKTLVEIGNECGLDGSGLYAGRESASDLYRQHTKDAMELQVFGAPWYEYRGVSYWGQDRLEFLGRALEQD
ncbi:2-hydroxychromene-2-carboxylate isomerase [Pollutimonas nitritireducens]|uniref:2-hydroxychromene-2-carboxylate isomerase n=1 Tax=Pollutimonas nitritireducens TaxID=2045209 RepID=A0A2N4UI98_9BURK|nr:2-hydroxychromene-2-carboxylate isomerase [Pollutimonas nitritireducens]PLC54738.1 2-hydroxychromene-2-carboxylate isomerase [Pollutimonas nitritireducens]